MNANNKRTTRNDLLNKLAMGKLTINQLKEEVTQKRLRMVIGAEQQYFINNTATDSDTFLSEFEKILKRDGRMPIGCIITD